MYPIRVGQNKSISLKKIAISSANTQSSSSGLIYPTAYYLNKTYSVDYRSYNNVNFLPVTILSQVDISNGVIAKDYFNFALQDIYGEKKNKQLYHFHVILLFISFYDPFLTSDLFIYLFIYTHYLCRFIYIYIYSTAI